MEMYYIFLAHLNLETRSEGLSVSEWRMVCRVFITCLWKAFEHVQKDVNIDHNTITICRRQLQEKYSSWAGNIGLNNFMMFL
jgi:flagellar biosynthesis chaperone FliJ